MLKFFCSTSWRNWAMTLSFSSNWRVRLSMSPCILLKSAPRAFSESVSALILLRCSVRVLARVSRCDFSCSLSNEVPSLPPLLKIMFSCWAMAFMPSDIVVTKVVISCRLFCCCWFAWRSESMVCSNALVSVLPPHAVNNRRVISVAPDSLKNVLIIIFIVGY